MQDFSMIKQDTITLIIIDVTFSVPFFSFLYENSKENRKTVNEQRYYWALLLA